MHQNKTFVLLVRGLIVLLLAGLMSCSDSRQPPVAPAASEGKARDFVLKDLSGRKFMLSEQKGKPVLIIFSTTWCSTCRSEIPRYKNIYSTYAPRGLVVVNIDIEEAPDKVARFAEKYQLPYRVLLDDQGLVSQAYQIVGVPTLVLLDQNGVLISRQYQAIEGLLEKLFRDS
jgi:peroxiredoxin